LLLKLFVYGTLKKGFPLSIMTTKNMGEITNIVPACLPYGQLYTQPNPVYPYLVLNKREYNNLTVSAPDLQKSIATKYNVGIIRIFHRLGLQYHPSFPVMGELVDIQGTPQDLLRRLQDIDRVEGFHFAGSIDNHYERRKLMVTNYPGEYPFTTLAWGYCLQPGDPYIARLQRIEENEWFDDMWDDADIFKELNDVPDCMECDKECSCDCPVFKAQGGY